MGNLSSFTMGLRVKNRLSRWKPLNVEKYRIRKPTLLCLGGNGTVSNKYANGICKLAQNLVGFKPSSTEKEIATEYDVDFLGLCYGTSVFEGCKTPYSYLTDNEAHLISKNLFVSLAKDKKGNLLSSEQIVKNFNLITIFAFCSGAKESYKLYNSTLSQLIELGLDDITINKALNQVFCVAYAPESETGFPCLQIFSEEDAHIKSHHPFSKILDEYLFKLLENSKKIPKHNGIFKTDEKTATLITSNLLNPEMAGKHCIVHNEHTIKPLDRDENWKSNEKNLSIYGEKVSQVAGFTLAKSVGNSINNYYSSLHDLNKIENQNAPQFTPKPSIDEVIDDAKSLLDTTQDSTFYKIIDNLQKKYSSHKQKSQEEHTVNSNLSESLHVELKNYDTAPQDPHQIKLESRQNIFENDKTISQ